MSNMCHYIIDSSETAARVDSLREPGDGSIADLVVVVEIPAWENNGIDHAGD